jgi:hypothetical protein
MNAPEFSTSNLSKIKTKFRTTGRISGNFGKSKVKGAHNTDLGYTKKDNINMITSKEDYIAKMYQILDTTDDQKIRNFAYSEIKKYLIQTGQWH